MSDLVWISFHLFTDVKMKFPVIFFLMYGVSCINVEDYLLNYQAYYIEQRKLDEPGLSSPTNVSDPDPPIVMNVLSTYLPDGNNFSAFISARNTSETNNTKLATVILPPWQKMVQNSTTLMFNSSEIAQGVGTILGREFRRKRTQLAGWLAVLLTQQ